MTVWWGWWGVYFEVRVAEVGATVKFPSEGRAQIVGKKRNVEVGL